MVRAAASEAGDLGGARAGLSGAGTSGPTLRGQARQPGRQGAGSGRDGPCGRLLPVWGAASRAGAGAMWTQLRSQGVRPVPTPSTRVAPGHTRDRTRACAQMHAKFNNPALATN